MFIVEAKVFSTDFWGIEGFKHGDVEFRPIDGYREIRKKIRKENTHYQTGVVTVLIPDQITDPEKAIDYTILLLENYSVLLQFAHNHDVFFQDYVCYELIDGKREQRRKTLLGLKAGKATGGANIYPYGMKEFISSAMPLILDEKFIEKTGIYLALQWYNEAVAFGLNVVEIRFPALWIALEILANSYVETNPKVFVFTNDEWRQLMEKFNEILKKLKISRRKAGKLLGAMGNTKRGSIVDRVNYLLEGNGFPQYMPEIPSLNEMRNNILHGRRLNYDSKPSPFDQMQKIERLLTKLILKVLKFYDKRKFIHTSIPKDDLLARA